jgi:hypothetical protein
MTPPAGTAVGVATEPEGSASSKSSTSTSSDSLKENGSGAHDGDDAGGKKKVGRSDEDVSTASGFASPVPNRTRSTLLAASDDAADSPDGRVATPVNLSSPMAKSAEIGVDDTAIAPPTPGLPMSPMHPAKPMKSHSPDNHHHRHDAHGDGGGERREMGPDGQWKISNIFSPVMNFLGGAKEEGSEDDDGAVAGQHAADVAVEEEEEKQEQGGGFGGVGADLDAEAAAAEGLVHLNDAVPAAAAAIEDADAEDTNDDSGYATAEEGVDADGDVAMEDVDG